MKAYPMKKGSMDHYEVESDMNTLVRAKEIEKDPKRLKKALDYADGKMRMLKALKD